MVEVYYMIRREGRVRGGRLAILSGSEFWCIFWLRSVKTISKPITRRLKDNLKSLNGFTGQLAWLLEFKVEINKYETRQTLTVRIELNFVIRHSCHLLNTRH